MFTTKRFYTILMVGLFIVAGLVFSLKNSSAENKISENRVVVSSSEMAKKDSGATEAKTVIVESTKEKTGVIIDVNEALKDRVLGNPNAPVTIVEYASMTCGHCAKFHNKHLGNVKRELIDTGKAKLILRDYPLDGLALRASMLARCAPKDKYFNLVEVLFANQEHWTTSKNPLDSLSKLGRLAGVSKDTFNACLSNKELEAGILRGLRIAQKEFKISSTPTFIFNGGSQKLVGVHGVEEFQDVVKLLSQGK